MRQNTPSVGKRFWLIKCKYRVQSWMNKIQNNFKEDAEKYDFS